MFGILSKDSKHMVYRQSDDFYSSPRLAQSNSASDDEAGYETDATNMTGVPDAYSDGTGEGELTY